MNQAVESSADHNLMSALPPSTARSHCYRGVTQEVSLQALTPAMRKQGLIPLRYQSAQDVSPASLEVRARSHLASWYVTSRCALQSTAWGAVPTCRAAAAGGRVLRPASWQLCHLRQAVLARPVAALACALHGGLPWAQGCPGCGRERVDSCTSWDPCEQHSFMAYTSEPDHQSGRPAGYWKRRL